MQTFPAATPAASRPRATSASRVLRKLLVPALLLAAILALLVDGRSIYSRAAALGTHTSLARDARTLPSRISYCDRPYLPGVHVTRAAIEATGNGPEVLPLRQVSSTAGGSPIFAKPLADSARYRYADSSPLPCAMVLYLKVAADDYLAYAISDLP